MERMRSIFSELEIEIRRRLTQPCKRRVLYEKIYYNLVAVAWTGPIFWGLSNEKLLY
jgi:hypothetical protein